MTLAETIFIEAGVSQLQLCKKELKRVSFSGYFQINYFEQLFLKEIVFKDIFFCNETLS